MSRTSVSRRALACAAALVATLTLGGCGDVSADAGVKADEIVLGVLSDQSGPFKNTGQGLVRGNELWVADVNARGGVCRRQIRLDIGDTSYRPEVAKSVYTAQRGQVLGYLQVLGSPSAATLEEGVKEDGVTMLALAWSSFFLNNPFHIVPGTTYDLEVINGLSYLQSQGLIKNGDSVGHIYIGGEQYGDSALLGASHYAKAHAMKLLPVKVKSTDADMSSIVAGFRGQLVKAIILTTSPAQTGSAVRANKAGGLNVPVLANNPAFDPALLAGPGVVGLDRLWLASSAVPYSSDVPKAKEVAQKFTAAFPQAPPTAGVPYGYALGMIWEQVLKKACDNKDLTKAGIQRAFRESSAVVTDDLLAALDFTKLGSPASRSIYLSRPDATQQGGLRQVGGLYTAPEAAGFAAPHQRG